MFYNVENLFDTYDDPNKEDDDFLPDGRMKWNNSKYYTHLRKTAQVINAVGEWGTPAICGLCEVENDTVIVNLLYRTSLREQHYNYCITTGSDARGINNALLYQRDKFKYLGHASRRIYFSNEDKRSRDILHVWGKIINGEQLDVFVCHFPSRSSGVLETERDRIDAAKYLKKLCDSILEKNINANILVMGDFNDTPADKSTQLIKKGSNPKFNLINLFEVAENLNFYGTHKFQGEWSQLDQIFVSQHLNKMLIANSHVIFAPDFLLTKKNRYGEQTTLRSNAGTVYIGGFSDHLPVVADFLFPYQ
jgi:endonuclease/exonuclease/phosphatase family metal-dependent hydrolase